MAGAVAAHAHVDFQVSGPRGDGQIVSQDLGSVVVADPRRRGGRRI